MKNMRNMNRQGGAVAVIVGISIFLLVGFLAMVIDLGHLYIAKTGLQNAADAAALSGAKELDETPPGVTSAVNRAIEAAGKNSFLGDFLGPNIGYQPVSLSEENIKFSTSPYTPDADWISYSAALSAPGGLYFVKVDTGQQNLHTVFAVIWNIFNMSTYGRAVAGRLETPISPLGLCAIDGADAEYGFRRGVGYSFSDVNNVLGGLGAGTELYLHPTATSSTNCTESGGNADFITPFLCTGKSAISGNIGSRVYTNTGLASCKALGAINTRFGLYPSCLDSSLNSAVCQPDTNVKQYDPGTAANWMSTTQPPLDQTVIPAIAQWLAGQLQPPETLDPLPSSISNKKENQGGCKDGSDSDCSDNYGVLWSYTRPVGAPPTSSIHSPDWVTRYPSGPSAAGLYLSDPTLDCADPDPSHPSGSRIPFAPYCYGLEHPSNTTYFQAPSYAGRRDRRLVNVVIVCCPGILNPPPTCNGSSAPSGICGELRVLGVGQFFLQTQAGGPRWISGEFVKLLSQPIPPTQIRLYQ